MRAQVAVAVVLLAVAGAVPAPAQQVPAAPVYRGGVPSGEVQPGELPLTLSEAVERGLQHNLGAILGRDARGAAEGGRRAALADLLPNLQAHVLATRQKINLAAFGITGPGFPEIVGPFNVFDFRGSVSQSVVDFGAWGRLRAASEGLLAAQHDEAASRDLVVLACASLYLQAVAGESRIAAAQAQLDTALALLRLAQDKKASGLAPGIDVLRANVQVQQDRQRVIVVEEEAAKQKLALARAIGLPLAQRFRLADPMPYAPLPKLELDEALQQAYAQRADLKAEQARVAAEEQRRSAALGDGLPSLAVTADYGTIGQTIDTARPTYTLGAALRVPLFAGGRVQARLHEADARLDAERSRLADLRVQIDYEVRSALLDLDAAAQRVEVADAALSLAQEQLRQAEDRFGAGIASNIDVVQAQDALAAAEESRIASVYSHNLAKAALARALGGAESSYVQFLRGN